MMEIITFLFALNGTGDEAAPPPKPPLLAVRRIFVDRLTGGDSASQIRDMIISSLQGARVFTITENPDRADAVLKGAAEDLIFTDKFNSSESLDARGSLNTGYEQGKTGSSRIGGRSAGLSVGQNESTHIEERKHEATAAVRLVDKNGDVIWSTTQESTGGKFRGASADVADRITRQLVLDYEKAGGRRPPPQSGAAH
jgi:hypothetical protein